MIKSNEHKIRFRTTETDFFINIHSEFYIKILLNLVCRFIYEKSPDAGGSEKVSTNRGFIAIPEVGDQVMVAFQHNYPDRPFVMGGMFHGKVGVGGGPSNNVRSFSSKSGNIIQLNDGAGIEIKDKNKNHVTLDGDGNLNTFLKLNNIQEIGKSLNINVGKGQATMTMDNEGKIAVKSTQEISFTTGNSSITLHQDGKIIINGLNIIIEGMETTKVIGHNQTDLGKCDGDPGIVVTNDVIINGNIVQIKGCTEVDIN